MSPRLAIVLREAGSALTIKITFAALLATIVTPYSVHRALIAPYRNWL